MKYTRDYDTAYACWITWKKKQWADSSVTYVYERLYK